MIINANMINGPVQILNEERKFYEKLYAKFDEYVFFNKKYPKPTKV